AGSRLAAQQAGHLAHCWRNQAASSSGRRSSALAPPDTGRGCFSRGAVCAASCPGLQLNSGPNSPVEAEAGVTADIHSLSTCWSGSHPLALNDCRSVFREASFIQVVVTGRSDDGGIDGYPFAQGTTRGDIHNAKRKKKDSRHRIIRSNRLGTGGCAAGASWKTECRCM